MPSDNPLPSPQRPVHGRTRKLVRMKSDEGNNCLEAALSNHWRSPSGRCVQPGHNMKRGMTKRGESMSWHCSLVKELTSDAKGNTVQWLVPSLGPDMPPAQSCHLPFWAWWQKTSAKGHRSTVLKQGVFASLEPHSALQRICITASACSLAVFLAWQSHFIPLYNGSAVPFVGPVTRVQKLFW